MQAPDYNPNDNPKLPSTAAIAAALNALAEPKVRDANHKLISKVAAGAIAGVTTVLNEYWKSQDPSNPVAFPSPSMGGTGDRMAICWALFGQAPDLSLGVDPIRFGKLYHACQALDFAVPGNNQCAAPEVFHTCIGSNKCKAQGGCGFVQNIAGGGICSHAVGTRGPLSAGSVQTPSDAIYSAPSDNKCRTFGGCAVPISASQVYPEGGNMELFDFTGPDSTPEKIGRMTVRGRRTRARRGVSRLSGSHEHRSGAAQSAAAEPAAAERHPPGVSAVDVSGLAAVSRCCRAA